MSQVTFVNTTHSATTNPTQLDKNSKADGSNQPRVIKKIIVGAPTAGKILKIYHMDNAYFNESTTLDQQVAFMYTYPTFGAGTPASDQFDFTSPEGAPSATEYNGLVVREGGSIETNASMQVTVIWDNPEA